MQDSSVPVKNIVKNTETTELPRFDTEQFFGAYVHFPFCETKCHYCDFFSFAESKFAPQKRQAIYNTLAQEVRMYQARGLGQLTTVFLGGGTPSLVPQDDLAAVLEPLGLDKCTEVTIEANPSSITEEKARLWRSLGVNRVSVGVQSIDDDRLSWLGRVHNSASVFSALKALHKGGIDNISVDYILGVPGQSTGQIQVELNTLASQPGVQHVSAYLLTLQRNNPKHSQLPDDQTQLEHLLAAHSVLTTLGFEHYEISNYGRPQHQALHNLNYWNGGSYLGVGPSAHGYFSDQNLRTKCWSNLEKYASDVAKNSPPWEWTEKTTHDQRYLETLMLGLRQSKGVDLSKLTTVYGVDLAAEKADILSQLQKKDLLLIDSNRLRLTTKGLFLCDTILEQLA